ncbi:hypothetical protein PMAYCL1PPCAC_13252 [Pristionchus mayeri]|uniref:Uncharacterized protein n=1 Tax=Pristionchus mayeri TaxID=1317129 RepID=A0AAN4ZKN5_9BILA|nr:hypothetical protein PMAYCL1PPCAC_13252 [Pristionchus mayeri]
MHSSLFLLSLLCSLLAARAALLPVECLDSNADEGCFEALVKRSTGAAPEKKGYDYIRFGKRSAISSTHAGFAPYHFTDRSRLPTRMFKPFLI